MGRWLAAAAAAVMTAGLAGPAFADDMNMGTGATCSPSGPSLSITAKDHKFDKNCLAVAAGQAFTIAFDNQDADRHNLAILPSHTATQTFFQGDILTGPKSITYSVPALKPGTWHFHCEIHPNLMNGTFIVAAAPAGPAKPAPAPTPPPMAMDKPATTPAPAPATSDMPVGPSRTAASAPAPRPAAAARPAGSGLPRTGPAADRLLLLAAGLALAAGGLSVVAGARRAAGRA